MAGDPAVVKREKFLALHSVGRAGECQLFALTPSSLAITVYRQQIRALNLAYAIYMHDPAKAARQKVAVIGGGFAGVTVTAGLLTKGFEVHLFEQRPELCHLQSGCETRSLHPTIYEWPSANSELTDARLPLLNWSAGTAGDVARSVVKQFYHIAERVDGKYHEYMRANARIHDDRVEWDNANTDKTKAGHHGRGGRARFDIAIIAVGFGVERGVLDTTTTSYWRNDRFGQPQPGVRSERRELVCVSGLGDGALIDLVRVCLRGFKQDRLIDDLFANLSLLVSKLGEIRDAHLEELSYNSGASLADALNALRDEPRATELCKEIVEFAKRIEARLRSDTRAILNGPEPSFSRVLNARGRSFLNVVLAYCLYEAKAFSYIGGACDFRSGTGSAQIAGYGNLRFDEAIIRHGTRRKRVLRAAGLSKTEITTLFEKQKAIDPRESAVPLWDPGWWSLPPEGAGGDVWWLERVPRAELMLATVALGPLSQHVRNLPSMDGCRFRATLHRAMEYASRENLQCYQQIAPYVGDATGARLAAQPGRVFFTRPKNGKAGSIGVVIETGTAFFAQLPANASENDRGRWSELWKRLIVTTRGDDGEPRFRSMDPNLVTTVAAAPVFAILRDQTTVVRYVIYIDVEHIEPDKRPVTGELVNLLWHEAAGIVRSIETLRTVTADDEPLLAKKSYAGVATMIPVPGREAWGEPVNLLDFAWLTTEFGDFVQVGYPPADMPVAATADVLELRSPV